MSLCIRTFKKEDEAAVIDLWQQCELTVPWNKPHHDITRKVADSPELFFVASINGNLVSTCMAGYDGHRGWIYYLAVRPDMRKKGIASQMVKHTEKMLADLGCPKIDLMVRNTNESVIGFYHSIGYSDDPVVVLSKRLTDDPLT